MNKDSVLGLVSVSKSSFIQRRNFDLKPLTVVMITITSSSTVQLFPNSELNQDIRHLYRMTHAKVRISKMTLTFQLRLVAQPHDLVGDLVHYMMELNNGFGTLVRFSLPKLFKKCLMGIHIFMYKHGLWIITTTRIAGCPDLSDWISAQLCGLKNFDICGVICWTRLFLSQLLSSAPDHRRVVTKTTIAMFFLNRTDHKEELRES